MILSTLSLSFRRWLAVLSLQFGIALSAFADSVEIDGLYYELNTTGRTATLTYQSTTSSNYSSIQSNLVVPASVTYNGVSFSVTAIGDAAFANCTALESITIPASVTAIGSTASWDSHTQSGTYLPFYRCTALKSVVFEDGNSDITLTWHNYYGASNSAYHRGMFKDCPLEEVYIGRNIKYKQNSRYTFEVYPHAYGYSAFYNQPKLTKITIGETVTEITPYLFYNNASITLMALPNVAKIGKAAFRGCSKLTTLNLGKSLTCLLYTSPSPRD